MADDEELNLDDGGSVDTPAKKGGAGGFFPTLLKWLIIGIAAIIVIVVVTVITVKIVNKGNTNNSFNPNNITEEYTNRSEEYDWYKSIGIIQAYTSDTPPATIRANVFLGYKKEDKVCSTEITAKTVEIKQFLRQYLRGKTAEELKNVNNEERFSIEIKNGINDKYLNNSKIRSVSFDQLDVVESN